MQNKNKQPLLSRLRWLYTQLSKLYLNITQARIKLFQRLTISQHKLDITMILNKQIDNLVVQMANEAVDDIAASDEIKDFQKQTSTNLFIDKTTVSHPDTIVENADVEESDFSRYIKQRKVGSIRRPQVGENLKLSAWEHIHSATRHAKNGKVDSAKIHAAIAGTALEEAGDYMNIENYSRLLFDIEKYFIDSKQKKLQ